MKRWRQVTLTVRYPDEKSYTKVDRSAYADSDSEACLIAIKQILAEQTIEALVGAHAR